MAAMELGELLVLFQHMQHIQSCVLCRYLVSVPVSLRTLKMERFMLEIVQSL